MSSEQRRSRIEVEDCGDIAVVNFIDRSILDEQIIQRIGEDLFALYHSGKKKILLNFQKVEYLSSVILGKFITLNKMTASGGGKLVMCNINEDTYKVFEITKLNRLFNVQRDEQGALREF